jgi:hypothetical protein
MAKTACTPVRDPSRLPYWRCPPKDCAKIVGPVALEAVGECVVTCEDGDSFASLEVATWCGADLCDGERWIVLDGHPLLSVPFGGTFIVVGGVVIADGTAPGKRNLYSYDPATGKSTLFGACTSPNLSPGGKWVMCMGPSAELMRIPIGGGAAEVVAEQDPNEFLPWAFDRNWPTPLVIDDAHVEVHGLGTIPWTE